MTRAGPRPGYRTQEFVLVTTLLDPVQWPVETLVAPYGRRWRVELYFDDIKTTMHAGLPQNTSIDSAGM